MFNIEDHEEVPKHVKDAVLDVADKIKDYIPSYLKPENKINLNFTPANNLSNTDNWHFIYNNKYFAPKDIGDTATISWVLGNRIAEELLKENEGQYVKTAETDLHHILRRHLNSLIDRKGNIKDPIEIYRIMSTATNPEIAKKSKYHGELLKSFLDHLKDKEYERNIEHDMREEGLDPEQFKKKYNGLR